MVGLVFVCALFGFLTVRSRAGWPIGTGGGEDSEQGGRGASSVPFGKKTVALRKLFTRQSFV